MPRNGSGTYQLPPGLNPVVTQTLITSNWANTTMTDIASALTASLARDGQSPPTANIPWGGFQLKSLGSATELTDAINLSMAQSSAYLRAMTVAGVNTITATLVGGNQVPVSGQLLILTPTSNNSGAATLALNGGDGYPITTPGGAPMKSGSLRATVPYFLMFYNGAWVIQSAGSGAAFAQGAISGWDRPSGGSYPAITIANTSTIAVPSGTGRIIAPGASNFTDATEVVWGASNVAIANLATAFCTTIGINAAGAVTQIAGIAAPEFARDNIVLGVVSHPRGQVIGIEMAPSIYGDMAYASYDLASLFRDSVVTGLSPVGNVSSPLHFDLTAGELFLMGGNRNNPDSPNFVAFAGLQDVSFFPTTGPGVAIAAVHSVPVTMYDPNGSGVVTAIPGDPNTAVIHRLYQMAGSYYLLYGQKTYPDVLTAVQSVAADDGTTVYPDKLSKATLLGYVIAQKNTTDLKSATAVLAKAGSIGGSGGGGGGISDAPIDGFMYARQNASWLRASPLLQGPAGTDRYGYAYTNALKRWGWGANATAEDGANSGSDWVLIRYNDAGTPSGVPLTIDRSNGAMNFESRPSFNGNLAWDAGNLPNPAQINQNATFLAVNASSVNVTDGVTADTFTDGTGNLRTGITSAAAAASAAQTSANSANTNANNRVARAGDTMTGQLDAPAFKAKGAGAVVWLEDRTSSWDWGWYSIGTMARLAGGTRGGSTADVISVNTSGNIYSQGRMYVTEGVAGAPFPAGRAAGLQFIGSSDHGRLFAYDYNLNVAKAMAYEAAGHYFEAGPIISAQGYGPTSDPRLKKVSGPIDDVFGRVMAINTCIGNYHQDYNPDVKKRLFIMADDQMAEKNPELMLRDVVEHKGEKYDAYDSAQHVALLTAGLQLALSEIESLKRKIK